MRQRLGVLPDARGVYKRLSARENIAYFGRLHGLDELRRGDHVVPAGHVIADARAPPAARRPVGNPDFGFQHRDDPIILDSGGRLHADRLWRYLRARGAGEEDAYDILAEAFGKFVQVVCRDLRAPLGLLYRIAINLQVDQYRRARSTPVVLDDEAVERHPDPSAEPGDVREFVRALIKTLPEAEQNLLLLRYWIGLTHKEIAIGLDRPEGTVRRQCAEALNTLKARWRETEIE